MTTLSYRLVHLDKLRLSSRREESDVLDAAGGKDPDIIVKNASESKGGVIEKYIRVSRKLSRILELCRFHLSKANLFFCIFGEKKVGMFWN